MTYRQIYHLLAQRHAALQELYAPEQPAPTWLILTIVAAFAILAAAIVLVPEAQAWCYGSSGGSRYGCGF